MKLPHLPLIARCSKTSLSSRFRCEIQSYHSAILNHDCSVAGITIGQVANVGYNLQVQATNLGVYGPGSNVTDPVKTNWPTDQVTLIPPLLITEPVSDVTGFLHSA